MSRDELYSWTFLNADLFENHAMEFVDGVVILRQAVGSVSTLTVYLSDVGIGRVEIDAD